MSKQNGLALPKKLTAMSLETFQDTCSGIALYVESVDDVKSLDELSEEIEAHLVALRRIKPTWAPPMNYTYKLCLKRIGDLSEKKRGRKKLLDQSNNLSQSERDRRHLCFALSDFWDHKKLGPTLKDPKTSTKKCIEAVQKSRRKKRAVPLPGEPHSIILADPPWKYDFSKTSNREIGGTPEGKTRHYETESNESLLEQYPAESMPFADNCVMFMWATAPKLLEALRLLEHWGFEYKTHAIWDKQKIGMGYWFRGQHELLLVGVRGKFSPPEPEHRLPSVVSLPRGKHSEKPSFAHELIEAAYPAESKLEMFARKKRKGWTAWGNQA